MASNSIDQPIVPIAGKWTNFNVKNDGEQVVPKPHGNEKQKKIWESSLMIPFSVAGDVYAYGGPLPDNESLLKKVDTIFACYQTCEPKFFYSKPYNFGFLGKGCNLFMAEPYFGNKKYISWLDRVEKGSSEVWKSYEIYDLIHFSLKGSLYKQEMLIAAIHFYEK
jgi:hypothetical protein